MRTLASEAAVRLQNTDGALFPFFSPDSQNVGFFADGKLKRISADGGSPQTLCEQSQAAGGTWNQDNIILFSSWDDCIGYAQQEGLRRKSRNRTIRPAKL